MGFLEDREREATARGERILAMLARGRSRANIAAELGISPQRVCVLVNQARQRRRVATKTASTMSLPDDLAGT